MSDAVVFKGLPIVGRMPPFKPALRDLNRKGKKTMTRRVGQLQCSSYTELGVEYGRHATKGLIAQATYRAYPNGGTARWAICECPYGVAGDIRCMTEPLIKKAGHAFYADDGAAVVSLITGHHLKWRWSKDYLTSIHFPTEAARFVVRYTEIVAERVQDISTEDAEAEGVTPGDNIAIGPAYRELSNGEMTFRDPAAIATEPAAATSRSAFASLWDTINFKRGYGWVLNPWVWGLRYKEVA